MPAKQYAKLARRLHPLSVWALSLGCIIGWGSFILPGTTFLPEAGPAGTALALAVAAVSMIIIAFNYSYLIKRFPVAGGEFTYTRQTFGTKHAFAMSWLLGLCYLALVAQNATALALVGRHLLGGVFQTGYLYSIAGYDIYAGELGLALAALVLFAALSIRGVHFTGMFQTILVVALIAGIGIVAGTACVSLEPAALAPSPAFSPQGAALPGMLAVLSIAPFLFVGFDTIPQAAEEYHFSPDKAKVLIVISILCGAVIYAVLTWLAAVVLPAGYDSWPAYIAATNGLDGVAALPTFNAAFTLLGPVGLFAMGLAVCGAILSGIVGFYMACSRLLFSMGREGVLPRWFSAVHPQYQTPHHALLFILGVSAIAPFFGRTVLGWLVDMSALGAAVAYMYASLVALRLAHVEGRKTLVVTGALGTVFSVVFVVLLLVPLPGLHSAFELQSYICLALWLLLGAVFAYVHRKHGAEERYVFWSSLEEQDYPAALQDWYTQATGRSLNLAYPQTFDEKIQWLKLYDATPEKGRLSDKYLVRAWVARRVGEEVLVPLLGVWERAQDIDFDALPERFVLKATHGCGWNIIVEDKHKLDRAAVCAQLTKWLETNYAFCAGLELQYRYCEPRIIAEAYLENVPGDLYDYKFFCFNGRVECIGFVRGRAGQAEEACFDRDWHKLPCTYYTHPRIEADVLKPSQFARALAVAETLSEGFGHVRVDLYMPNDGTVRFGEMTFTTLSGNARWNPPEYNDYFGSLLDLSLYPAWQRAQESGSCLPHSSLAQPVLPEEV